MGEPSCSKCLETGNWKLEIGNWKLEVGNRKLETGRRKLEGGNWRLENGNWKLEKGNWKLENGNRKEKPEVGVQRVGWVGQRARRSKGWGAGLVRRYERFA
jgi:hypothetical protein